MTGEPDNRTNALMLPPIRTSIVSTVERPDLVPVVARWLWETFGRAGGHTFEHTLRAVEGSVTIHQMPRTLILLVDGSPVGTASLVAHDLDERPDLSPWLAGVFVEPDARGQGYAALLIAAVEKQARRAAIPRLWLYTKAAERIYARVGWRTVDTVEHGGKAFALMCRDLVRHT
jgi:GNAT superfamily N-acetyltransferase